MDFGQAALLMVMIFVFMQLVKKCWPAVDGPVIILLALAAGVGVVYLAGTTVWAHDQVIGGHPLDDLNAGSKVVAGLLLGAGSVGIAEALTAVKNIGQNQDVPPPSNP